jgi:hypothetical protein
MECASLLGVVGEMSITKRRPVLQLVSVRVCFLVTPVGVMAIEISNEHGRMGQCRENISTVPVLTGGFVDISDVVTADTDDITVRGRQDVSGFGDVATDISGPSVFWMQCIAHEVESTDGEAAGYVSIDMSFLEADDVDLFLICDGTDDTSLCG